MAYYLYLAAINFILEKPVNILKFDIINGFKVSAIKYKNSFKSNFARHKNNHNVLILIFYYFKKICV